MPYTPNKSLLFWETNNLAHASQLPGWPGTQATGWSTSGFCFLLPTCSGDLRRCVLFPSPAPIRPGAGLWWKRSSTSSWAVGELGGCPLASDNSCLQELPTKAELLILL